ncbi:MAG: phosphopeptide-binding protein [Bacteroidia bacterium]|nr:phosphopeptide-binding protein [Bacteroidia bacterium]
MKNSFLILFSTILFSCGGSKTTDNTNANEDTKEVSQETTILSWEKNGIKVTEAKPSPEFTAAKLKMNEPELACYKQEKSVKFSYAIENYELGLQTQNIDDQHCANSTKGQHIHLILNNQPYTAHYNSEFDVELEDGFYVALSFVSRSYHESIKNTKAYHLSYFTVGMPPDIDPDTVYVLDPVTFEEKVWIIKSKLMSQEHMFYSRPKGNYDVEDCESLMLDFYLVNTTLSEEGNKVKAIIDGEEFILPKWCPYSIEGLGVGEHTISLELIDKDGQPVSGPFNFTERTITIEGEKSS